jgi:hypothetical protein
MEDASRNDYFVSKKNKIVRIECIGMPHFPFFPSSLLFCAIGRKKEENKENKSESLLIEKTKKQKIHAFYT